MTKAYGQVKIGTKTTKGFSDRLAKVRGKRSQRQFARDIDTHQQNVNRYERGTTPHLKFVVLLYEKEGIDPTWLLTGKGSMKAKK